MQIILLCIIQCRLKNRVQVVEKITLKVNRHEHSSRKGFRKDNFKVVKQKQNGRKLSSSDCLYLKLQYQGSGFGLSVSSLALQPFAEEIRNDKMKPELCNQIV